MSDPGTLAEGVVQSNLTAPPSRPMVVITAPFDDRELDALAEICDVAVIAHGEDGLDDMTDLSAAGDKLAHAHVLVVESAIVDSAVLKIAPSLKLVVACRSNPVTVDLEACRERDIRVATTPARNADVTADMAIALLLGCVRQIPRSERWLREGHWTPASKFAAYRTFRGPSLRGRTLGLIGLGAVGGRVARRAAGFGMVVIASDPNPAATVDLDFVELCSQNEVLQRADMLSIHAPLLPSTIGLIGRGELAMMQPGGYLVNSARAAIVDEDALIDALTSGHLAGAGLDVFVDEPLPHDHPLLGLENVVLTPHIGGASDDVIVNHSRAAYQEISRLVERAT